jgi:hypothetical protein
MSAMRAGAQIALFVRSRGGRADDQHAACLYQADMAHRRQGPVAFDEVAVAPRGGVRVGPGRPVAGRRRQKGSLGTLCPRLPRLLAARISSGLAGEELHGRDK